MKKIIEENEAEEYSDAEFRFMNVCMALGMILLIVAEIGRCF